MNGQCMATCMAVALSFAAVAFGEMGARSGFVPMITPGDAFAPVNAVMDASADTVDTDVVFEAVRTEDFTVDGDLTKPVWRKARPIPSIACYGKAWPEELKSNIRFLYSTNAIYVAATLWQDMSKVVCKWDQRDMPTWGDDNLELFLFIPLEDGKNGLFQFVINPLRVRFGIVIVFTDREYLLPTMCVVVRPVLGDIVPTPAAILRWEPCDHVCLSWNLEPVVIRQL